MGLRGRKHRTIEETAEIIQDKSYLDANTGCYIWDGCLNGYGYGVINYLSKQWLVHRWIFVHVKFEPLVEAVRHSCDRPACWCPAHLIGGTSQENVADMIAKGRQNRGSAHPRAVFTEEQVLEIRASSIDDRKLSKILNVNQSAIRRIRLRHTWKHL